MCPNKAISLIDVFDYGIRPKVDLTKCQKCGECLKVCPGIELSHSRFDEATIPQLRQSWGPVLEVWEGYATDPEIRFKGSSGGAATALALYCLEKEKMAGVLHIGSNPEQPLSNIAVFSRNREELLVVPALDILLRLHVKNLTGFRTPNLPVYLSANLVMWPPYASFRSCIQSSIQKSD